MVAASISAEEQDKLLADREAARQEKIREDIDRCKANPSYLDKVIEEGSVELIVMLRHEIPLLIGKDLREHGKLWERVLMSMPTSDPKKKKKPEKEDD